MLCLVFQMVVFHFPGRSMVQLDLPNLEDMGPAIIVPIEVFQQGSCNHEMSKSRLASHWDGISNLIGLGLCGVSRLFEITW